MADAFARNASAVVRDVPSIRAVRRATSQHWRALSPGVVLEAASILVERRAHRWAAWELVRFHHGAFASLDDAKMQALASGLDSWDSVDAFARTLSGPPGRRASSPTH